MTFGLFYAMSDLHPHIFVKGIRWKIIFFKFITGWNLQVWLKKVNRFSYILSFVLEGYLPSPLDYWIIYQYKAV